MVSYKLERRANAKPFVKLRLTFNRHGTNDVSCIDCATSTSSTLVNINSSI
jgi:hypothetical protein